ncbi:MAG: glycerol-3-phosphate dehydrogenase/oxidase [Bacteroidota bacterium]
MIEKIESFKQEYDFIIIGGGATGIGILLEAITRGYSAVLFEASDFTKSTSSKSTKLVHGGVRYLAQGNIGLVREACIERGRLKKNAPHIVKRQSFIIPVFSFYDEILYTLGLKFYDFLAGRYSMGSSKRISSKKTRREIPTINTKKLKAGVKYIDGQFDDSRLGIAVLQSAIEKGAVAVNYFPVEDLIKDKISGHISGVVARDLVGKKVYQIEGKHIINATGVFADDIIQMDKPGTAKTIQPSQGVHLILPKEFLPGKHALMIPRTEDGRVLFAVPWLNKVVLGTTDTLINEATLEPQALEEEVNFILRTASQYLTRLPSRKDVLSVFTGLRPLAANKSNGKTKELSRSHKIFFSETGLFTIIGGKWTTFRKMGEDMVNRVEKKNKLSATVSVTKNLKLFGYTKQKLNNDPLYLYGNEAEKIRKIQRESAYDSILSKDLNISAAEIVYCIRNEMPVKLEDVLARRTRALLLDAREALNIARSVAEIMANEMSKDEKWIENEIEDFEKLARKYILDN